MLINTSSDNGNALLHDAELRSVLYKTIKVASLDCDGKAVSKKNNKCSLPINCFVAALQKVLKINEGVCWHHYAIDCCNLIILIYLRQDRR